MRTIKITNITNLLNKRNTKKNTEVIVEYVDGMIKKSFTIKPNDVMYLTHNTIPPSIHRLRILGLITVDEINNMEMNLMLNEVNRSKSYTNDLNVELNNEILDTDEQLNDDLLDRRGSKKTRKIN